VLFLTKETPMPSLFGMIIIGLVLAPPLYAIGVVLFDNAHRPHERNILALGGAVLFNSFVFTLLGGIGWLIDGETARLLPLLLICVAALTVYRLMGEPALKT
jgi:hypothetical protein